MALYGPLAASTRYRLGQYIPHLAEQGIELRLSHLLGDEYLRSRFAGKIPRISDLMQSYLKRIDHLWHQRDHDVVFLHCELLPLIPGTIEELLLWRPYIYDFDDAFYLKYRTSVLTPILGHKFETVIRSAAAVTAGNYNLRDYARLNNERTFYLPTVVDVERYRPASGQNRETFTVGWIGSPSTASYLRPLVEPLSIIAKESRLRLVVIGGRAPRIPNIEIVELPWSEDTEIDLISSFDVGVMPLPDDEWARGKCAFKLIQYLACGVPVIGSRVGANIDVITEDCGFLAGSVCDWVNAIRAFRDREDIRKAFGNAGRKRVAEHYSLQRNVPILADIIRQVASGRMQAHAQE